MVQSSRKKCTLWCTMAGGSEDVYVMVQTGRKIGTKFSGVRVGEKWHEEVQVMVRSDRKMCA